MKENKFKYIAVIQKGNSLHVEANKEEKPNWKNYKLSIDNCIDIEKWESKHQYFPFSSMEDMNKTRLYLHDIKRQQIELNKWDVSDCIEIKDGYAYFKEKNSKNTERKNSLEWWNNLTSLEQDNILKNAEIYGHDEGVNESEIIEFYNNNKKLGVDFEFTIGKNGMVEEIPIKIEESQMDLLYDLVKANTYQGTDKALQQFKIIRIK